MYHWVRQHAAVMMGCLAHITGRNLQTDPVSMTGYVPPPGAVMEVRSCQVSATLTGACVSRSSFERAWSMCAAPEIESAALRRLTALMQRDDDEAHAAQQAR